MTRFEVIVVPRSSTPGPAGTLDGIPRLRVKAPPSEGRANEEAQRALSKLLGLPVRLVAGSRSRRKSFEAEMHNATLHATLRDVFAD